MNSNAAAEDDFYYKSEWEKHGDNLKQLEDQRANDLPGRLEGSKYGLNELLVNVEFFAHEAPDKDHFDYVIKQMFNIVKDQDINVKGSLTPFWKCVNALGQRLVRIHPDWRDYIKQRAELFDRENCVPFMKKRGEDVREKTVP